jgi:DNA-binding HxlR family transcriptional regulator
VAQVQPSAIGQALLAVGDQWTLLILQRAFLKHTRRFAEWRDDLGVSESVLAGRLKAMVDCGLLRPVPYRNGRTRLEYWLTDKAIDLWPMMVAIWSWEHTWVDRTHPLPTMIHLGCGRAADVELGCAQCGKAPVSSRDTTMSRTETTTFAHVSTPRPHRRTARDVSMDALSYLPTTMEIIGDRWATVVLAAAFMRYRRFSEFEAKLGPPPSVLSERLRRFTELDVFYQNGAEYRLTPKGQAFFPIYAFLVDWAQRWFAGAPETGIAIRHETCEQPLRPYLRCTSCLEPMSRTAIKFDVDTP